MKTLYLRNLFTCGTKDVSYDTKYFVIGVKDSWVSLEAIQGLYPQAEITRFPEVMNPKYIHSDTRNSHILQPAFITFPLEKEGKK